jgi:hypothetical protein
VPRIPMPAGVPLSVATSIMSLPSSFAGISKYNRLPCTCVLNSPFRVRARGVITVAYGRGVGSPSAAPAPVVGPVGAPVGVPPFGAPGVGVPGVGVVGVVVGVTPPGRALGTGVGSGVGFCVEHPTKPVSASTAAPRTATNGNFGMRLGDVRKERGTRVGAAQPYAAAYASVGHGTE